MKKKFRGVCRGISLRDSSDVNKGVMTLVLTSNS